MAIHFWMGKQNVVHPCNKILLSNKKEAISDACDKMDECQSLHSK